MLSFVFFGVLVSRGIVVIIRIERDLFFGYVYIFVCVWFLRLFYRVGIFYRLEVWGLSYGLFLVIVY